MFKYHVNLRNATIRIQLSAEKLARILKHFGQTGQFRVYSGELYSQGHGWYLAFLNEDAMTPEVAARRFLDCLRVALRSGATVEQSKKLHAELQAEVAAFLKARQRRFVPVDLVQDHGRTVGVARTHLVSAFLNRDAVITQAIREIEDRIPDPHHVPASASKLQALVATFQR